MVDPRQKKLLTEIMEADAKDGLYDNHKLTAVEWLLYQIENKNGKEFSSYYTEFIEKAKEKEEERMFKIYHEYQDYLDNEFKNQCGGQGVILTFEQYYNETYNK